MIDRNTIEEIIYKALKRLIENDKSIFLDNDLESDALHDNLEINRKLHEITINHRFAYYLENELRKKNEFNEYYIDLEYNRYFNCRKLLDNYEYHGVVRPDIIIHSRVNTKINPMHLLVIEAKKESSSENDRNKIKGFIIDNKFGYKFGLTVSYCSNVDYIIGELYFIENGDISIKGISIKK